MFENVNWVMVGLRMLVFYMPIISVVLVTSPMVNYCNTISATPRESVTTKGRVLNVVFSIITTVMLVAALGLAFYLVGNDTINGWLHSLL